MQGLSVGEIGVVVIGRNEGSRLARCLASVSDSSLSVVYVDSGSTDGSLEYAIAAGTEAIQLDGSSAYSAARARNAGALRLLQVSPGLAYLQFLDGDCALLSGWLEAARDALSSEPTWGVVCGRLREREPRRNVYTALADIEWMRPIGVARHCGGIAMYRVDAWNAVGGFDESLIAGEEPELCLRLKRKGWQVHCLGHEMALHDIHTTTLGQWGRRCARSGLACASAVARHGGSPDYFYLREFLSMLFWGCTLPLLVVALAFLTAGASFWALLLYPLQILRVRKGSISRGLDRRQATLYAFACTAAKGPQAFGALSYMFGTWFRRGQRTGATRRVVR